MTLPAGVIDDDAGAAAMLADADLSGLSGQGGSTPPNDQPPAGDTGDDGSDDDGQQDDSQQRSTPPADKTQKSKFSLTGNETPEQLKEIAQAALAKLGKTEGRYSKAESKIKDLKSGTVPLEKVQSMIEKAMNDAAEKQKILSDFPETKDMLPQIEKVMNERGVGFRDAVVILKGERQLNPGYAQQQKAAHLAIHGELAGGDVQTLADSVFSQSPKFS